MSSPNIRQSGIGCAIHPMSNPRAIAIRTPGRQCRSLIRAHGVSLLRGTRPAPTTGHRCAVLGSCGRVVDGVPDWENGAWRMARHGVRCATQAVANGARDRDGGEVTIRLPEVKSNLPLSALILKNQWVAGCRWGVGGKGKTSP
jgi:hypothetical protein